MRTRTRTLTTTFGSSGNAWLERTMYNPPNPPSTSIIHISGPYSPYTSLTETVIDELPKKMRSGYCKHTKVATQFVLGEDTVFTWVSAPQSYRDVYKDALLYDWVWLDRIPSAVRNNGLALNAQVFDYKTASYHALEQMRPSLDEGLLLPNLMAELAEMGILARKSAQKAMERAERERQRAIKHNEKAAKAAANKNYRRNWEKSLMQSLVPSSSVWNRIVGAFGTLARKFAWANLAWQFAVRPTISDAKKIVAFIDNYRSRLSELIRQANKRQIRHYKRPVDNIVTLPATLSGTCTALNTLTNTYVRSSEYITRPTYRASMLFTYDASAMQNLLGRLDGLLHSFGVNRVASIVWEAIPFSFVVDWFVNVGDVIASIEDHVLNDPLPIVIHDFSHSLKYSVRTRWTWSCQGRVIDICHRTEHFYERRRDYPSLWDSLSVHSPNLNQAGLGLSLIVLRMDGITRRR